MSLYFRKSPLEGDADKETQIFGIPSAGNQCSSTKLCSHSALARRCRRQFSCLTKDQDDRSAPIWRFLCWVAYERSLAGPNQITSDERLRCPMIECRALFDDQNKLLEHIFRCALLSDGHYWCFNCQKKESFGPFQCKHCHAPGFRKDRLSTKAKRIFRWLGTKSHQKDHEAFDSPLSSKGVYSTTNNQCSAHLADYTKDLPRAAELGNTALRELRSDYVLVELNGFNGVNNVPAELDSENTMASTFKFNAPSPRSRYPAGKQNPNFTSEYAGMVAVQEPSEASFDMSELQNRFGMGDVIKPTIPKDSLLQFQSPVSPQSPGESNSYTGATSESPTNTDFSSESFLTRSFGDDSSTRHSMMQSFSQNTSQSPSITEKNVEYQPTLPVMSTVTDEMPSANPVDKLTGEALECNDQTDSSAPFNSSERHLYTHPGSGEWLTPKNFLLDFWKILVLHIVDSSTKLKSLPDSPTVNKLLSMTPETIADLGLSSWHGIVSDSPPVTIEHLYALIHIAYAFAIVIFDGHVTNHIEGLFTHSLSIAGALSNEDKLTYKKIVWSIWSPPVSEMHTYPRNLADFKTQPNIPPRSQSWAMEPQSSAKNELLSVLAHSLDLYVGIPFYREIQWVDTNRSHYLVDESFVRIVQEGVINPLILTPSLEIFIPVVSKVERLVNTGRITTIHDSKVALLLASRNTTSSMELYHVFSIHVKEFCNSTLVQTSVKDTLGDDTCALRVREMAINLKSVISEAKQRNLDEKRWRQSRIRSDVSSSPTNQEYTSQKHNTDTSMHCGAPQRYKRKRTLSSSTSESGPSPSSSSSNTVPEGLESEYVCQLCGFQSEGKQRYHKRSMERHMNTHLSQGQKKAYLCEYDRCNSSFTRPDNLKQHVRMVHQRNKRQRNLGITSNIPELGAQDLSSLGGADSSPNSLV